MLTHCDIFFLSSGQEWRQSRLFPSKLCAEGPARRASVEGRPGPSGQPRERTHGREGITGEPLFNSDLLYLLSALSA